MNRSKRSQSPRVRQRGAIGGESRLGSASIWKLLIEFSVPAVAGVLMQTLYNVIDAVFVGYAVGEYGLAATTVANPLMTIMPALAMLIGIGGSSFAAIKLGEGDGRTAKAIAGNCVLALLVVSLLFWLAGAVFVEPLMIVSGADAEVLPYAVDFASIIILGAPLQLLGFGMSHFIRTAGYPVRAFAVLAVGTLVNVALGFLFVIVFGWGMRGAASATVLSWLVSAILVLVFLGKPGHAFSLDLGSLSLRPRLVVRSLMLGLAPSFMEIGYAFANVIMNNLLLSYGELDAVGGDGALAIMRVASAVGLFLYMPSVGVATGSQPIIGFNHGAGFEDRVGETAWKAAALGTAVTAPLWIALVAFPEQIALLFSLPEEYLDEAAWSLVAYQSLMLLVPAQTVLANYFNATGKALKATFLTLARQVFFLIPLLFICPIVLPVYFPVTPLRGVLLAPPLSDIASTALVLVLYVLDRRSTARRGECLSLETGQRYGR